MSDSPSAKRDANHGHGETRREIIKKAAYIAPAVLTLAVSPGFAQSGLRAAARRARPGPGPRRLIVRAPRRGETGHDPRTTAHRGVNCRSFRCRSSAWMR